MAGNGWILQICRAYAIPAIHEKHQPIRRSVNNIDWEREPMDPTIYTREFGLTIGILISVLVALLGGIWRLIQWGLKNVVEPVKDRHLKYLDDETDMKKKQLAMMEKHGEMLQNIQGTQQTIAEETTNIKAKVTSIFDKINPNKN